MVPNPGEFVAIPWLSGRIELCDLVAIPWLSGRIVGREVVYCIVYSHTVSWLSDSRIIAIWQNLRTEIKFFSRITEVYKFVSMDFYVCFF